MNIIFIDNGVTVENNIQEVSESKLMSMAVKMNTPEWNDILLEAAEWGVVAGLAYYSFGFLAKTAIAIKMINVDSCFICLKFKLIFDYIKENLDFDQLINEYNYKRKLHIILKILIS